MGRRMDGGVDRWEEGWMEEWIGGKKDGWRSG